MARSPAAAAPVRRAVLDERGRPVEVTRAQRMALRVLQVGAVAVVLAAAEYRAFELDRFFVPKELVLVLVATLAAVLCLGSARRVSLSRTDLLLGAFLVVSAVSAAIAANPWAGARALGVSAGGIAAFWAARSLARAGLGRPLLVALAAAVVAGVATSLMQAYGARLDVFSLQRSPGGTLGNRNFVAHLAAFGLPLLLLGGLRAWRAGGVLFAAAGVGASAAVLVLTRSRAAWLAVAAVLAIAAVGWLLTPPVRRSVRSWGRLGLMLAFAGGGVAAALLLPNALRWRSDNPYAETAAGVVNYQEGSGRGRLVQWRNSLRMTAEHPLLGVGPGNWPVVYPRFAGRRDPSMDREEPGTTSNPWPSSDWVAFLSERGPVAFALLVAAFLGMVGTAWTRMRRARDADEGLVALGLMAMLGAVAVVGAFDAVLMLALPSLLVWAALGALSAVVAGGSERWSFAPGGTARALLAGLVLVVGGAFTLRSAGQLAAMGIYTHSGDAAALERAARLDPGSYRVHLRLARALSGRRSRERRCEHAEAAHALLPEAAAAKVLRRGCGGGR